MAGLDVEEPNYDLFAADLGECVEDFGDGEVQGLEELGAG